MYGEAKKLHIIEQILKIEDASVLAELESVISKNSLHAVKGNTLKKFAGIWSTEEAEEVERIIKDNCEQINPNDWK